MTEKTDIASLFTIDDLVAQAPSLMAFRDIPQFQNLTMEEIVFSLDIQASADPSFRPGRHQYWRHVKHELYIYFCTDDERYRSTRLQFAAEGEKIRTTAATILAGAIGGHLGTTVGMILPLVVLALIAISQIGKNAFCKSYDIDVLKPFADKPRLRKD